MILRQTCMGRQLCMDHVGNLREIFRRIQSSLFDGKRQTEGYLRSLIFSTVNATSPATTIAHLPARSPPATLTPSVLILPPELWREQRKAVDLPNPSAGGHKLVVNASADARKERSTIPKPNDGIAGRRDRSSGPPFTL